MSSYVYTANATSQQTANLMTGKVRIATTTSAITFDTGYPRVTGNGTATAATNSNAVTGVSSLFSTQLAAGYWIGDTNGNTIGIVANITSNTALTLTANAANVLSNAVYTYNPYGVAYAIATANSSIIPANTVERSVVVGTGNTVAFLNVTGTAGAFSVTELGAIHANTGTGVN